MIQKDSGRVSLDDLKPVLDFEVTWESSEELVTGPVLSRIVATMILGNSEIPLLTFHHWGYHKDSDKQKAVKRCLKRCSEIFRDSGLGSDLKAKVIGEVERFLKNCGHGVIEAGKEPDGPLYGFYKISGEHQVLDQPVDEDIVHRLNQTLL